MSGFIYYPSTAYVGPTASTLPGLLPGAVASHGRGAVATQHASSVPELHARPPTVLRYVYRQKVERTSTSSLLNACLPEKTGLSGHKWRMLQAIALK